MLTTDQRINNDIGTSSTTRWDVGSTDLLRNAITFAKVSIVVSGEKSGVGKTYFARRLLRYLHGWSALKVTVRKDGACPHDKNCGICRRIKKPFYIVKDENIINQHGKDTARLKEAGAKEVIWLQARPDGLRKGLEKVFSEFSDCRGLIIEGTSVLKFFKPDLNIHLHSKGNYAINKFTRTPVPRNGGAEKCCASR